MKNILLIGYDSNICLGVSYCLSKLENKRIFLLTSNKKNAGRYSRFINKTILYDKKTLDPNRINEIISELGINLIFPYDEDEGIWISTYKHLLVNEHTKCIWLTDPDNYKIGTNKYLLANLLHESKISVPRFIQKENKEDLIKAISSWETEFIMKPSKSSFGRGIIRFKNIEEFENYSVQNEINYSNILFQPYLQGSDITANVLAFNGEVLYHTVQETPIKTDSNFVSGDDFVFKPDENVITLVKQAIKKLNWSGIACFDLRRNNSSGEIYILEINGRFWASLVAAYEKGGINFPLLIVQLAFDEKIEKQVHKYNKQISLSNLMKGLMKLESISILDTKYIPYLKDPIARISQLLNC
jgi:glutathione synthase/RimK-type ligase-like ATP-grasp enzyme